MSGSRSAVNPQTWIVQALLLLLLVLLTPEINVVQSFLFNGRVRTNAAHKRISLSPLSVSPLDGNEDGLGLKLRAPNMTSAMLQRLPPGMNPTLSKKDQEKIVVRLEAQAAAANGTAELKSDLDLLREGITAMLERMS
ncbi:hypothetical protein B484DRAFT_451669 [Ochromonadaceae sp. CCMP2298]|nr:hypothetical protein B484DRAFT_451669 [Ochromonadaceae sp. CCMP2298]